ncbi:MAG TPA: T9SS type A sorting domain-containing protein [Candidatus Kapabacteria bacterium]|nr:T9SS type A sorting domain-containing protein [Candidatus Kapabacteria bacterium]
MKKLTVIPLLYVLSFLMVSAGSGSAQIKPAYPYSVLLSFDTALITYDFHQTTITPDTIRGFIQDESQSGSYSMTVNIQSATQWIISTTINGSHVQNGDVIPIAQNQILPVEVIVIPYAEKTDTESYCMTLTISPTYIVNHQCITLAVTNGKSVVSTDPPTPNIILEPNPAGSYMFVRGLTDMQASYRYEIYSVIGVEVLSGTLPADGRINVQDLPSGAYRLLLSDAKRTITNTAFTVLH